MKQVLCLLILLIASIGLCSQKTITIEANSNLGLVKNIFGGNKGGEQIEQADYLHDIGIKEIRIHDYHEEGGDYFYYSEFWTKDIDGSPLRINPDFNPKNPVSYDWSATDHLLKSIRDNNFDIYFRIGTSYPNPDHILQPQFPPFDLTGELDFTNFAQLATNTIRHYNNGWNEGYEYDIEYWEIWNEPGGFFWDGSVIQFYKMYETVSDSIKSAFPNVKVGALGAVPATTLGVDKPYKENFISYCSENNVNLDFYSWHIYGLKNPYGLKRLGIEIRNLLDDNGFVESESHITEINDRLSIEIEALITSSRGAAYFLSLMLTAQDSKIDKMFLYPSQSLIKTTFDSDRFEMTKSAYAMHAFNNLLQNTPIRLETTGNEVVMGLDDDSKNLMLFSAKNETNEEIGLLISNFESEHSSFVIDINDLPWLETNVTEVSKIVITDEETYAESSEVLPLGASSLLIEYLESPSVAYLKFSPGVISSTQESEVEFDLELLPNPTHKILNISSDHTVESVKIFNLSGQKMLDISDQWKQINIGGFPSGQYVALVQLTNGIVRSKKFIVSNIVSD